jgi:transposase-like protein
MSQKQPKSGPTRYVTAPQLASTIGIEPTTLRRWLRTLPQFQDGGYTNYKWDANDPFLKEAKEHYAKFVEVERVQTGVRIEKRMLKVLKAIAEQKDMTLGDLLEGIVLHAFEGKAPFSERTLKEIEQFKGLYGMTLNATDGHNLKERKR